MNKFSYSGENKPPSLNERDPSPQKTTQKNTEIHTLMDVATKEEIRQAYYNRK